MLSEDPEIKIEDQAVAQGDCRHGFCGLGISSSPKVTYRPSVNGLPAVILAYFGVCKVIFYVVKNECVNFLVKRRLFSFDGKAVCDEVCQHAGKMYDRARR